MGNIAPFFLSRISFSLQPLKTNPGWGKGEPSIVYFKALKIYKVFKNINKIIFIKFLFIHITSQTSYSKL